MSPSSPFLPGFEPDGGPFASEPERSKVELGSAGSVVLIGNFDGVHRGHRALLGLAERAARARGLSLWVLTFHPHPVSFLRRSALPFLTTPAEKVRLLRKEGARVWVEHFDQALADLSPEEFVKEILVGRLNAKLAVVGKDFRFGKGRSGDVELLARLGESFGFSVETLDLLHEGSEAISSSRIRAHLLAGEIEIARDLLGRPPTLVGKVVRGDERGRLLGFPTANLEELEGFPPSDGVYACEVFLAGEKLGRGVANWGARPTVGRPRSLEVHILDYSGDLYGKSLEVRLSRRLRDVMKFPSLDALVEQIRVDVAAARDA